MVSSAMSGVPSNSRAPVPSRTPSARSALRRRLLGSSVPGAGAATTAALLGRSRPPPQPDVPRPRPPRPGPPRADLAGVDAAVPAPATARPGRSAPVRQQPGHAVCGRGRLEHQGPTQLQRLHGLGGAAVLGAPQGQPQHVPVAARATDRACSAPSWRRTSAAISSSASRRVSRLAFRSSLARGPPVTALIQWAVDSSVRTSTLNGRPWPSAARARTRLSSAMHGSGRLRSLRECRRTGRPRRPPPHQRCSPGAEAANSPRAGRGARTASSRRAP